MNKNIKFESYYETVSRREKLWPVSRIAKDYGLSGQALNKLLCKAGIISKTTNSNRQYILNNKDYGEQKAFSKSEREYIGFKKQNEYGNRDTICFNKSGMIAIYKVLVAYGIKPLNDMLLDEEIDIDNNITCKPYDLILTRRPGLTGLNAKTALEQTYYISYYKNKTDKDKFGLNYQYLTETRAADLQKLMEHSQLSINANGPRIDSRDLKQFKKVEANMNEYFNLFIYEDLPLYYNTYIDYNKCKCKEVLANG